MKFNDEELAKFKEDFKEEVKFLEKKYQITISLGNITSDDTFFSARIICEHAENTKEAQEPPKKFNSEMASLAKEVLEPKKEEEKKKEASVKKTEQPKKEEIKPRKPEIFNQKKETKPVKKQEQQKKETKKNDLDDLDLDNFVFDDIKPNENKKVKDEPKKKVVEEPKKAVKNEKKAEKFSDDDILNIDLDDFTFDDIKPNENKKEKVETKKDVKKAEQEESKKKVEEPKKEEKKETKVKPKININELDIENMTDEEIDDLYENYEIVDEPIEEEKAVHIEAKNKNTMPRYDESLADDIATEEDDLSEFFDEKDEEPTNIFDEMKKNKNNPIKRVSRNDDIDDILSNGNNFSFSFKAKLIQGEGLVQDFYTDLKNELLSYKGTKSKISWDNETFAADGDTVAKININGNAVELYLALDPKEYEDTRYVFRDASKDPKYKQTPLKVNIKRYNDMQQAVELIEELMDSLNILQGPDLYDDYHYDYETTDELLEQGLVKKI